MTMPAQRQDTRTIRPEECNDIPTPRTNLQMQWEIRNQAAQEQRTQEPERARDKQKELYVKGKEKAGIMQPAAGHSEMPGGWN